jgi:ANTAR domain
VKSNELPRSIHLLALLGSREAGADGYALYQVDFETDLHELKLAWGAPVGEPRENDAIVDSFHMRLGDAEGGLLQFVCTGRAFKPAAHSILEQMAQTIEEVWRLSLLKGDYARKAARVGDLETELADSKIADRVRGLLADEKTPGGAVNLIVKHVESVLRPGQLGTVLEQITQEVEQEIAERELAGRAKAVLQSRYGMSEDQAHVHLRLVSRKSRKRLRDVARDLLEEELVQGSR